MTDLTILVAFRKRDAEAKKFNATNHQKCAMSVSETQISFNLWATKDMAMTKNVQEKLKMAVERNIVVHYGFVRRTKYKLVIRQLSLGVVWIMI